MTTMPDATTRVTAGVDTHRDQHVVAALDERGGELGVRSFATTTAGYRQALAWLRSLGPVEPWDGKTSCGPPILMMQAS